MSDDDGNKTAGPVLSDSLKIRLRRVATDKWLRFISRMSAKGCLKVVGISSILTNLLSFSAT